MFATGLVFVTVVGFTAAAVLAFYWAAQDGQMSNLEKGAKSIFDADEPEGRATDSFPDDGKSRNS
jgi:nitrogen fixation-related uncharacterized protein